MAHEHGTHSPTDHDAVDAPRETVREREIIVTNSGPSPERSSGFGLVVGLIALIVLIVLGVLAVRVIGDSVDDAGSLDIPNEIDVNIDDGDEPAPTN